MPIMSIEKVSRLTGLSAKVLRDYEKLGLIRPLFRKNLAKKREYNDENYFLLQQILIYKRLGFSLKEIAKKISNNRKGTISNLKAQRREIRTEINKYNRILISIEDSIKTLKCQNRSPMRKETLLLSMRETPFVTYHGFERRPRFDKLKIFDH